MLSPSGKYYIGKAKKVLSNGIKNGTTARIKSHVHDSRRSNGGNCRLLNIDINTYGIAEFKIDVICSCMLKHSDKWEIHFIKEFNSLYPNGLNIQTGGTPSTLSAETKAIMSRNRKIKPCFAKPHTDETKKQISLSLIDNVVRYDFDGSVLPKYMKYVEWKDRRGYHIVSHPACKLKNFVSKNKSLQQLYAECSHYLGTLEL